MGSRGKLATSALIVSLLAGACSGNRDDSSLQRDETTTPPASTPTSESVASTPESAPSSATSLVDTSTPPTSNGRTRDKPRRTTTTTTTLVPAKAAHNPKCAVRLRTGDSLFAIAEAVDDRRVTIESLQRENRIEDPDHVEAGDLLDICVGNKIDDVTGKPLPAKRRGRR